ncbi:unnamed protein product [Soboliphyme baturini]|uniref:Uncharacterized protein n=1 Tax=Soboliphyme baturini TaxID=241478 RepID=A0A183J3U7_9BILA|nr:unnamed protein product [Soboliphyme baturini]
MVFKLFFAEPERNDSYCLPSHSFWVAFNLAERCCVTCGSRIVRLFRGANRPPELQVAISTNTTHTQCFDRDDSTVDQMITLSNKWRQALRECADTFANRYRRRCSVGLRHPLLCCYASGWQRAMSRLFAVCLSPPTACAALGNPGDDRAGMIFDDANTMSGRDDFATVSGPPLFEQECLQKGRLGKCFLRNRPEEGSGDGQD